MPGSGPGRRRGFPSQTDETDALGGCLLWLWRQAEARLSQVRRCSIRSQVSQRPAHFGVTAPQDWQTKRVVTLAKATPGLGELSIGYKPYHVGAGSTSARQWANAVVAYRRGVRFRLVRTADGIISLAMDTTRPRTDTPRSKGDRKQQIAREAAMIAEGDADIAARRTVDDAKVDAWIDSIGTGHELPPPYPGG